MIVTCPACRETYDNSHLGTDCPHMPESCLRGDGTRCAYVGGACQKTCALRHPASLVSALDASIDGEHARRRAETAAG